MRVGADGVVGAHDRAVEIGGDQLGPVLRGSCRPPCGVGPARTLSARCRPARLLRTGQPRGVITPTDRDHRGTAGGPWVPGRVPSGCWWFSRIATSQRVVAEGALSVAATLRATVRGPVPDVQAEPVRILRTRQYAVRGAGQLPVPAPATVSQRLAVELPAALEPRSPAATSDHPVRHLEPWPASPPPRPAAAHARRPRSSGTDR